jgi:hypothetical protein
MFGFGGKVRLLRREGRGETLAGARVEQAPETAHNAGEAEAAHAHAAAAEELAPRQSQMFVVGFMMSHSLLTDVQNRL